MRDTDEVLADLAHRIPSFGGSYLDANGTLQIWMRDLNQNAAHRVASALSDIFDEDFIAVGFAQRKAKYSFLDLKKWHDRIRMNIREVAPDLVFSGFDERNNGLVIGLEDVERHRDGVEEELRRQGIPLEAVSIDRADPILPQSSLRDLHRPLVGGLQIEFWNGTCTHGFSANRSGTTGFVTNSHCSTTRSQVDDGLYGQPLLASHVGQEIADPSFFTGGNCPSGRVCRRSDANFVDRSSLVDGVRRIARLPLNSGVTWNSSNTYRVTEKASGHPTVGLRLFKVGRTTGRTRGDVNQNCWDTDVSGTNITLLCQVAMRRISGDPQISAGGDSGSPWFRIMDSPQTHDVRLMGIHWGATTDGEWAFYSKMNQIDNELGTLKVCFSGFSC